MTELKWVLTDRELEHVLKSVHPGLKALDASVQATPCTPKSQNLERQRSFTISGPSPDLAYSLLAEACNAACRDRCGSMDFLSETRDRPFKELFEDA